MSEPLSDRLRARGQRVTSQRLVLNEVLGDLGRHVSAEEVVRAASDRLPGLSLPTVYATLDLFEELGLVRRVPAAGGAVLYDPRTDEHAHLVCRNCGTVQDLEIEHDFEPLLAAATASGAKAERAEVVVAGLCADCA
jgi:Fur family ferric uptake transcriptional regulator/Fur family peroxide stress response transcriptional regulator